MRKLILFIGFLIFGTLAFGQTYHLVDTLFAPSSETDTLYYFPGYTGQIIGVMVDFRDIDDTTDARLSIGVGWDAYDTTFIQLDSDDLPATIKESNDYIVAFEKIGMAFPYPRLLFTKGSSSGSKQYPVRITYDR